MVSSQIENLSVWLSMLLNSIPVCITCSSSCQSKRLIVIYFLMGCKIEIRTPEMFLGIIKMPGGAACGTHCLSLPAPGCILKSGITQQSGCRIYLCNKQSKKSLGFPGDQLWKPEVNDLLFIIYQTLNCHHTISLLKENNNCQSLNNEEIFNYFHSDSHLNHNKNDQFQNLISSASLNHSDSYVGSLSRRGEADSLYNKKFTSNICINKYFQVV